jgi:hypothetical protein
LCKNKQSVAAANTVAWIRSYDFWIYNSVWAGPGPNPTTSTYNASVFQSRIINFVFNSWRCNSRSSSNSGLSPEFGVVCSGLECLLGGKYCQF